MLIAKDLVFGYNQTKVIRDVSLELEAGRTYSMLGSNGSGKTTLIKLLCGLLQPEEGSVTLNSSKVTEMSGDDLLKFGYEPQELGLYDDLSIIDNLKFYSDIYNVKDKNSRINELLELMELGKHQDKKVSDLSGGMKKKVSFAVVIMHEPPILLLDEPTAAIDPILRVEIMKYLNAYAKNGNLVLMSTHQFGEVRYTDEVFFLHEGKLLTQESSKDLVSEYGTVEDAYINLIQSA